MDYKRPVLLHGETHLVETGCGHCYITINKDKEMVKEVFMTMGKAGGCASCQCETTGRLATLALRGCVGVVDIVKMIKGITCHHQKEDVLSCSDGLAKILEKYA